MPGSGGERGAGAKLLVGWEGSSMCISTNVGEEEVRVGVKWESIPAFAGSEVWAPLGLVKNDRG